MMIIERNIGKQTLSIINQERKKETNNIISKNKKKRELLLIQSEMPSKTQQHKNEKRQKESEN